MIKWISTGQTLPYIMTSRSRSLEPKSQLIINLDPGWECQSLPSEEIKMTHSMRQIKIKISQRIIENKWTWDTK